MNLGTFQQTLTLMRNLDNELRIQSSLEQIRDNLNNIVSAPAQPQFQAALANALTSFQNACTGLAQRLTPEDFRLIAELEGQAYFDPSMADRLRVEIGANAMTPSVPQASVQKLTSDRATYMQSVKSTLQGLGELGVSSQVPAIGTADAAFAIPRDIFNNDLGDFAKEIAFLNRLLVHLSEAKSGSAETITVEGLSSSTPTIAIGAGIKVISSLAELVSKFLDAWERIQKFRAARQQLTELGLSGKAIEEVSEQITTTIEEVVEETVEINISGFRGDAGRKNELRNALTQDTRRLFGQIERGLTIQFRANPDDEAEGDEAEALEAVNTASKTLQYPVAQAEPVLLMSSGVLDGEIPEFKYLRKTTSKKTTTKREG